MNLDTPESELLICEEPEEPTCRSVNPTVTAYGNLKDFEREELAILVIYIFTHYVG